MFYVDTETGKVLEKWDNTAISDRLVLRQVFHETKVPWGAVLQ